MHKIILTSFALFTLSISTVKAQSIFDKIDNAINKADNAVEKIDKASNTTNRASKTGSRVASIFGKKNKKGKSTTDFEDNVNKTVINIENIDLINLKKLNSIILSSTGVTDSKIKFNHSFSTIMVMHTGNTEKLLENIQSKTKGIISDKNIVGFDEGNIEIKMK